MTDAARPAARACPVKIVITVPWGERLGGAENILWTFLRHVDHQVVLPTILFLGPGAFQREVAALGFETSVIPAGRLRQVDSFLRTVRGTTALFRSVSPNLIVNWSAKSQVYAAVAAGLARMADRLMWWQQGIPDGHWLDRVATILPTQAIACYSAPARLAQEAHWPSRRAFVIHPGIDPPVLLANAERSALRERLGIPRHRSVVGIVGRLQPWKGQDRFLRAIAALRRRGCAVHGLIVGGNAYNLSPGYERELHELAHELGLDDHVTFTGQVPDSNAYLQVMDVSVNASMSEPFGLVLLEAMAAGVPVVAFAAGGPTEIVESGTSGMLVDPDEPEAMADGLARLLDEPALRRRIGEAGRQRFLELFSAERMTRQMERLFLELSDN